MISRMCFQLKMDRPVILDKENPHYISPGGYNIGGISFDFCDITWNRLEDDKRVICVEAKHLDIDSLPESEKLTLNFLRSHKFNEFFVFTGDTDDLEINPVKIVSLTVEDDKGNLLMANNSMLKNINEVLCN